MDTLHHLISYNFAAADETGFDTADDCHACITGKYCKEGKILGDCAAGYYCRFVGSGQ